MVPGKSHSIVSTLVLLLNRSSEQHWQTVIDKGRLMADRERNLSLNMGLSESRFLPNNRSAPTWVAGLHCAPKAVFACAS